MEDILKPFGDDWIEKTMSFYYQGEELRVFNTETGEDRSYFTEKEKIILSRLWEGKSRADIAKELGTSRINLRQMLQRIRNKRDGRTA